MRTRIIIALLVLAQVVWADVVVLNTGRQVDCTILLENENVVVVRDANGARFQYPTTDIREIRRGEVTSSTPEETTPAATKRKSSSVKASLPQSEETSARKATIGLELMGGLATGNGNGGGLCADVLIGSRQIAGREILLGGQVGYMGIFGSNGAHFVPIQMAFRYPILSGRHTPLIGANIGYGIGMKGVTGGIHAGLQVAYRYALNERSRLLVGLAAEWQQATMRINEEMDGEIYSGRQGRNLLVFGVKIGFNF